MDDGAQLSATDRRKQNSHRRSQMAESHAPTGNGNDSDEEPIDVRKMKVDFDESKQIMALVEEIEEDYANSKKQVNTFDSMALDADCSIKTLK